MLVGMLQRWVSSVGLASNYCSVRNMEPYLCHKWPSQVRTELTLSIPTTPVSNLIQSVPIPAAWYGNSAALAIAFSERQLNWFLPAELFRCVWTAWGRKDADPERLWRWGCKTSLIEPIWGAQGLRGAVVDGEDTKRLGWPLGNT